MRCTVHDHDSERLCKGEDVATGQGGAKADGDRDAAMIVTTSTTICEIRELTWADSTNTTNTDTDTAVRFVFIELFRLLQIKAASTRVAVTVHVRIRLGAPHKYSLVGIRVSVASRVQHQPMDFQQC